METLAPGGGVSRKRGNMYARKRQAHHRQRAPEIGAQVRRRGPDEGFVHMSRRREKKKQKEGVVAAFRRDASYNYNCMRIMRD